MSSHILVIIGEPGGSRELGEVAREIATYAGTGTIGEPRWLAPDEAAEIPLHAPGGDGKAATHLRAQLQKRFAGAPVDICVVAATHRRKKLLVADMDSTIIQQECIDEMADVLGLKPKIAAITERAMRGELAFEAALKERLGLLAGITEDQLQSVYDTRVQLMPGAKTLIATMRANGAFTALVSGGFTYFTARVAHAVGFDLNRANTLELVDGRLTGRVVGPILGREAKLAALREESARLALAPGETLAVGDGANDLDMIRAAGLGVAYRAKPVVAAEAHASITHGDLTALLYLQGYTKTEHVS